MLVDDLLKSHIKSCWFQTQCKQNHALSNNITIWLAHHCYWTLCSWPFLQMLMMPTLAVFFIRWQRRPVNKLISYVLPPTDITILLSERRRQRVAISAIGPMQQQLLFVPSATDDARWEKKTLTTSAYKLKRIGELLAPAAAAALRRRLLPIDAIHYHM